MIQATPSFLLVTPGAKPSLAASGAGAGAPSLDFASSLLAVMVDPAASATSVATDASGRQAGAAGGKSLPAAAIASAATAGSATVWAASLLPSAPTEPVVPAAAALPGQPTTGTATGTCCAEFDLRVRAGAAVLTAPTLEGAVPAAEPTLADDATGTSKAIRIAPATPQGDPQQLAADDLPAIASEVSTLQSTPLPTPPSRPADPGVIPMGDLVSTTLPLSTAVATVPSATSALPSPIAADTLTSPSNWARTAVTVGPAPLPAASITAEAVGSTDSQVEAGSALVQDAVAVAAAQTPVMAPKSASPPIEEDAAAPVPPLPQPSIAATSATPMPAASAAVTVLPTGLPPITTVVLPATTLPPAATLVTVLADQTDAPVSASNPPIARAGNVPAVLAAVPNWPAAQPSLLDSQAPVVATVRASGAPRGASPSLPQSDAESQPAPTRSGPSSSPSSPATADADSDNDSDDDHAVLPADGADGSAVASLSPIFATPAIDPGPLSVTTVPPADFTPRLDAPTSTVLADASTGSSTIASTTRPALTGQPSTKHAATAATATNLEADPVASVSAALTPTPPVIAVAAPVPVVASGAAVVDTPEPSRMGAAQPRTRSSTAALSDTPGAIPLASTPVSTILATPLASAIREVAAGPDGAAATLRPGAAAPTLPQPSVLRAGVAQAATPASPAQASAASSRFAMPAVSSTIATGAPAASRGPSTRVAAAPATPLAATSAQTAAGPQAAPLATTGADRQAGPTASLISGQSTAPATVSAPAPSLPAASSRTAASLADRATDTPLPAATATPATAAALSSATTAATMPVAGVTAPAALVFAAAIRAAGQDDRKDQAPTLDSTAAQLAGLGIDSVRTAVTAAQGGSQSSLDMRQDAWPHAMLDHIERLRDSADAMDTRIRVVPDALGSIDVSVRKDGDAVHVHFSAEQAQTRQLLQDAQPRLADYAESRGLKLAGASVGSGQGQGTGGEATRQPAPQPGLNAAPPSAAIAADEADATDSYRIA